MTKFRIVMVLALVACALPLTGVLISSWIAQANGCVLNEGDAHACVVMGMDIGDLLYNLFVMGWLMLLTLPAGAALLLGWIVTEAVQFFRKRRAA